ncbi:hypothetical protein PUN4_180162 [Paraburkholderia unamae]|jgi:hypothetical protein|nr:hypothetical protein PUN4_180162 [Paraburkholderia unamae]
MLRVYASRSRGESELHHLSAVWSLVEYDIRRVAGSAAPGHAKNTARAQRCRHLIVRQRTSQNTWPGGEYTNHRT